MARTNKAQQMVAVYAGAELLAGQVQYAADRHTRGRGLIGRPGLGSGEGLLLVLPPYQQGRCGLWVAIHMLGVPFPLAVAWLDAQGVVVHAALARPWRPYYSSPAPAWYTLELHPARAAQLLPGTHIRWVAIPGRD